MRTVSVKGAAKVIRLYNVSRLEIEGVDWSEYDLTSQEDVRELFEIVNDFVETGEAEAIEPPQEILGVDPDQCAIKVGDRTLFPDEITLENVAIEDLLSAVAQAEVGDIFYIRSLEGDGEWIIESDAESIDPSKLSMGYVDCGLYFDQYDVLREGYLDVICDTVLPERIKMDGAKFEVAHFIFDPVQIYGQLYKVVEDPATGVKVLQKIDYGGRMLAGTDFIVDDFDAN